MAAVEQPGGITLGGVKIEGSLEEIITRANQALEGQSIKLPLSFQFRCDDVRYAGQVSRSAGKLNLALSGDLGVVPFSAENARRRKAMLELLRVSFRLDHGEFYLTRQQRLLYRELRPLTEPLSIRGILATTAEWLVRSTPYIRLARAQAT